MKKETLDKTIDVDIEYDVGWEDDNQSYHAFPTDRYRKPVVSEKDGCWEVTVKKIKK